MSRRRALLDELARLATAQAAAFTALAELDEGGVANDAQVPGPPPAKARSHTRRGPRVVSTGRLAEVGAAVQITELDRKVAEKKLGDRGMLRGQRERG